MAGTNGGLGPGSPGNERNPWKVKPRKAKEANRDQGLRPRELESRELGPKQPSERGLGS